MFAIAIYDGRSRELVLMRDRAGKKPLYYARLSDGSFVFGSEIKVLEQHPAFQVEANVECIPEYLTFGYVAAPNSFYKGVHKLEAAHVMTVQQDGTSEKSEYWHLRNIQPDNSISVEDAKVRVKDMVGRAVEKRLTADVPLGAFLSGGVDSSIVSLEMARRSSSKVRTFAVGFEEDKTYDETAYAQQVADLIGTDHTKLVVKPSPADLFDTILDHHDEPFSDSSAFAVYAVSKATREHVTAVLTGDGGDEVFGGYTRFLGGMIQDRIPSAAISLADKILRRLPEPRGYKNPLSLARRFVENAGHDSNEQFLAWNSYFGGKKLARFLRPDVFRNDPFSVLAQQACYLVEEKNRGGDRLSQILKHNYATYLPEDLLIKTDRMTMAVSLEARSPFLDTDLVEMAFSLPSKLKVNGTKLKWILKEAYRDEIPSSILDREKHGFGVPVGAWWSGPLKGWIDDLLRPQSARYTQYLPQDSVVGLLDEHAQGHREHGLRIFTLAQLELWLQKHQA